MTAKNQTCGIIAPRRHGMPHDEHGCVRQPGHDGCHEYVSDDATIAWQNDLTCDCEECRSDEPDDWCVIWERFGTTHADP